MTVISSILFDSLKNVTSLLLHFLDSLFTSLFINLHVFLSILYVCVFVFVVSCVMQYENHVEEIYKTVGNIAH